MPDPLDLTRIAVRIETLMRTPTHSWGADELEFRRALPPQGGGPNRQNQLPDPVYLRDMATKLTTLDNAQKQALALTYRYALQVTLRMEGIVRDNDPQNPKRLLRDMVRGRFPGIR